jgi:hypothetical protein
VGKAVTKSPQLEGQQWVFSFSGRSVLFARAPGFEGFLVFKNINFKAA